MSKLMRIAGVLAGACALARASGGAAARGSFSCDVGEAQCCANVYSPTDTRVGAVLKMIGLDASGAAVGVACDAMVPGGPSCEYTAACCTNNGFSGMVSLGCARV